VNSGRKAGRPPTAMITMPDGRRLLLRDAAAELGLCADARRLVAQRVGAGEWML